MPGKANDRDRQSDECERIDFCRRVSLIDSNIVPRLH